MVLPLNSSPFYTIQKVHTTFVVWTFRGASKGTFACATIPDKQWGSTVYPNGKLHIAIFSLIQVPFYTIQKVHTTFVVWTFRGASKGTFACATIPDKQWGSTVYPNGKLHIAIFSLIQVPFYTIQKVHTTFVVWTFRGASKGT